MKLFRIGEHSEVFAANSADEAKSFYRSLVDDDEAAEAFNDLFEEIPAAELNAAFEWTNDDGEKTMTTWRKQIEGVDAPCQVASSYI